MSKKKRAHEEAQVEGAEIAPSPPEMPDETTDPETAELAKRFAAEPQAQSDPPPAAGTIEVIQDGVWFHGRPCKAGETIERPSDVTDEQLQTLREKGFIR